MSEEQEAREAVASFLASFGLREGEHRDRLIEHGIARARGRYANVGLAHAAVRSVRADLEAWAAFILGDGVGGESPLSRIRAAYLRCGGPARWPEVLCCYDLAEACVHELRRVAPPKLPPEAPSPMPRQALDRWSVSDLAAAGRSRPATARRASPASVT